MELCVDRYAAEDRETPELHVLAVVANRLFDLKCKLTRRGNNKGANAATLSPRRLGETLQHWQNERGGLAGSGLRASDQIMTGKRDGNGLRLNVSRHLVARSMETLHELLG